MAGSVGLVVEGTRRVEDRDGFEWYCFNCGEKVHRIEITVTNIVKDLPPLEVIKQLPSTSVPSIKVARTVSFRGEADQIRSVGAF